MTRDDLERRVAERIADGVCWMTEDPVEVFESIVGAEGRVACTFSPGGLGLVFHLDEVKFPCLRQKKAVDWLVLIHVHGGSVDAHLIEFKQTVGPKQWREVKDQMASSITRALALAGALQAQIQRFCCYTAYRKDRIHPTPDHALIMLPFGPGTVAAEEPEETRRRRAAQLDWEAAEIHIEGMDTPVPHRRVLLDPASGIGHTELLAG